jgi:nucleoside-diphosphate-sugar epimerase
MKILITGAGGMQGASAIFSFLKEKDVSQLVVTDINENVLREKAARFADKRLTAKYLDITDKRVLLMSLEGRCRCNTSIFLFKAQRRRSKPAWTLFLRVRTGRWIIMKGS